MCDTQVDAAQFTARTGTLPTPRTAETMTLQGNYEQIALKDYAERAYLDALSSRLRLAPALKAELDRAAQAPA